MPPLLRLVGVVLPAGSSRPQDRLLHTSLLSAANSASPSPSPSLGWRWRCRCRRRRSSRFSNAEPGDDTARRWWSDAQQDLDYDLEDEYDDGVFGGAAELFDEPWFYKVFRKYGYVLPVMLASMLVATGPKAFLMAMAIPVGQSAISFVLDAIWGTRGRRGNRRTTFEEYEYNSRDFQGQEKGGENKTYSYTWQSSYQQPSESDDAGHSTTNSSRGGQAAGTSTESGFGGWDELDDDNHSYNSKRSPPPGTPTADDPAVRRGVSRRRMSTRRMGNRYKQAPFMMRLLVAVFPFLGSWFRIL